MATLNMPGTGVKPVVFIIITFSILITAFAPAFMGPGLSDPEPIGPFLGGALPEQPPADAIEIDVAFSNLTFNTPLTWDNHPNQDIIFVGQRDGKIYHFENDQNTASKNLFLDLSNQVGVVWDGGFLGMVLHPNFGTEGAVGNNYFYTYYTTRDANGGNSPNYPGFQTCNDSPQSWGGFLVLSRWEVEAGTLNVDENSELEMIKVRLYNTGHRGGGLVFGGDGMLYLTMGDQLRFSTAQNLEDNLDGSVLRLDVNSNSNTSHPPLRKMPDDTGQEDEISGVGYWIPNDNPFNASDSSRMEEYYAIGMRSPHRISKDKETNILYVGDVGSASKDEIDILEAGKTTVGQSGKVMILFMEAVMMTYIII